MDRPTVRPPETSGPHYAPALDGLRAVAVLLVVLFHLNLSAFSAGFLGVDVFFVISGFLITTLMLREVDGTGRLSLPGFWARRVRRLFPALAFVLIVVTLASLGMTTPSQRTHLRGDLLTTTAYVANFRFIGTSDYFSDTGIESPLEHTWSLAIEEQYYLIWPLVVFGLLVALRTPKRTLAIVASAGAAISAVLLAVHWSPDAVERAYMGTDSRVFEPLIGAAGAVFASEDRVRATISRYGPLLAPVGALALIAGMLVINPSNSTYYFGGAVWVSLATLLITAASWQGRGGLVQAALEWRPLVWIGVMSYGVYLWHWPAVLALGARYQFSSFLAARRVAAVALTIGMASLSYYGLERPIRRGWRAEHPLLRPDRWRPRRVLVSVPVIMALIASTSLAATYVPSPTKEDFVVMLAGDSVPKRLMPALERAADDMDWRFVDAAMGGCPTSGEDPVSPDGESWTTDADCRELVAPRQARFIRQYDPDVILWWDRSASSNFMTMEGEIVLAGTPRFWELRRDSLNETTARLGIRGARIVFVATEPVGPQIDRSYPWYGFMVDHYFDVTLPWNQMRQAYAKKHPDTTGFVSLTEAVCRDVASPCDDRIDGLTARPDGQHYFGPGEEVAARTLLEQLLPLTPRAMRRASHG